MIRRGFLLYECLLVAIMNTIATADNLHVCDVYGMYSKVRPSSLRTTTVVPDIRRKKPAPPTITWLNDDALDDETPLDTITPSVLSSLS